MKIHWNLIFKRNKKLSLIERKLKRHGLIKISNIALYVSSLFFAILSFIFIRFFVISNYNLIALIASFGFIIVSYLNLYATSDDHLIIEEWIMEKQMKI